MRAVSNAFLEASLSPIGFANAYMVINNSTTIDASNITEISIQEDVGDTGAFSIGTFNATEANITVLTKALPNTITGVPIKIYFGYYIGGGYEYVPMGTFYAKPKDVTRKNYFTVIKAYDTSMRMSDGYRSTLNWSNTHTVTEVLNEVKNAYSLTLGSFGGLPPSSVTVYQIPTGTYRDVVMQMALLMGTNAKFNRSGSLDFIKTYPATPVESYTASNYGLGDLQLASVAPISYGKLIVHYHYTSEGEEQTTTFEYTAGTGSQAVVLDTVNIGTTQETSALGSTVLGTNGMSYYGYDVTLPGQPQIDLGDTIRVEDLYGTEYDLLVMSATHTFNGAMKSTFNAVANEEDPSLDGENMGASITEQVSTINDAALYAVGKAEFAADKADEAAGYADQSRISSEASAASATESARQAGIATGYANTAQQQATASAQSASASAQSASQAASSASAAATSAQNAANDAADANTYANAALDQLGIVQDVIGVLEWASTHGTFTLTTDTTVQEHKVYFTYNLSTGDYEPVIAPEGNPRQQGYYELSMTEAMQEFILSHLAVTSRGLWVLPNGMGTATDAQYAPNYKVLLSNDGMYVYDSTGVAVSTYGANITFSATRPQSIGNANAGISFNPDNGGTITITGATINLGVTTLDQYLQGLTDRADEIDTIIRAYNDGVLTAKVDNEIGTLVNADGSFDIVNLTWNDDEPTIGATVARYSASGVVIYDTNGVPIAQYGQTAIMGNPASFHIEAGSSEIGLYEGNVKAAYLTNNRLYIPQAAATDEVEIGGKWVWKYDDTDQSLYLKWTD